MLDMSASLIAEKRVDWRKDLGARSPVRLLSMWGQGERRGWGFNGNQVSEEEEEQWAWKWKHRDRREKGYGVYRT